LEEGAEDFIVKLVKLSDVKRLKGYMATREVKVGSHDKGSGVDDVGVEINNKRKLEEEEETSDMSLSLCRHFKKKTGTYQRGCRGNRAGM